MKSLLSDQLVAKYRSIPEFVWYIISTVAIFFANAYSYIVSSGSSLSIVNETFAEVDLPLTINPLVFISLSCVFSALFSELLFEIINHLTSGILLARFSAKTNRSDLKFRLRLCFIYANLLTGIVGIVYFFTQNPNGVYTGRFDPYTFYNDVQPILDAIIPFSSLTYFIYLFLSDTFARFIPKKNHARALLYIGRIYFGVAIIVTLLRNLSYINAEQAVVDIVSDWLSLAIRVIWAVLAYLYYRFLKKQPKDDENETISVIIEDNARKNIYDDFGF